MAKWFKITDRASGDFLRFHKVEEADATAPPDHDPAQFEWQEWPGEPTDDDMLAIAFAGAPEREAEWREERSLGQLTRRGRHRLAVNQAKLELIDDLLAEGVIPKPAADRLKARAGKT